MNKTTPRILGIAVIVSLIVGGIAGFFLGVTSTKAGKAFIKGIFEEEKAAEVSHPKQLIRERFKVQYPSNWSIDVNDEDYDPDHLFSIDSPGNAFVMFVIGSVEVEPEEYLQKQIRQFEKVMSTPTIVRFERFGSFTGKGATLRGKIMGISTTTRLFSFHQNDLTIMITQQCPDEDLKQTQAGLSLIENSFSLTTNAR